MDTENESEWTQSNICLIPQIESYDLIISLKN